jgi:hypothetical protein
VVVEPTPGLLCVIVAHASPPQGGTYDTKTVVIGIEPVVGIGVTMDWAKPPVALNETWKGGSTLIVIGPVIPEPPTP